MRESNNLTKKEFWHRNWKAIKLPAGYFYGSYARKIIADLIDRYVDANYGSFLEIGGCPGRWADYFYHKHNLVCDSMDYDDNNIKIIEENYRLLNIRGKAILGDITNPDQIRGKQCDIVLSDGLIEHFSNSSEVFKNHLKFLKKGGLLVVGTPNIKESWFYNFFAKRDWESYNGYRHVSKEELKKHAENNGLKILFCDYAGVFNMGVVNSFNTGLLESKLRALFGLLADFLLKKAKVKKETNTFSPAIYLIAKKAREK